MIKQFDPNTFDDGLSDMVCDRCGETLWSGAASCPNCDVDDLEIGFVNYHDDGDYRQGDKEG
jgi:hypothetical protein